MLDSDLLIEGRNAPARELLRGGARKPDAIRADERLPVAGIVVSSSRDRLPAACNTVIEIVSPDGDAVAAPHRRDRRRAGAARRRPRRRDAPARCARDLARFEDPELRSVGAGLPDSVRLLPLLELDGVNAGRDPPPLAARRVAGRARRRRSASPSRASSRSTSSATARTASSAARPARARASCCAA